MCRRWTRDPRTARAPDTSDLANNYTPLSGPEEADTDLPLTEAVSDIQRVTGWQRVHKAHAGLF